MEDRTLRETLNSEENDDTNPAQSDDINSIYSRLYKSLQSQLAQKQEYFSLVEGVDDVFLIYYKLLANLTKLSGGNAGILTVPNKPTLWFMQKYKWNITMETVIL
jgi:hypothetical protein